MQESNNTEEYVDENELEKDKEGRWRDKFRNTIEGRYFVPIIIVLIAVIAFSLGRVSGLQEKRAPVRVIDNDISGEIKGASINTSPPNPSPVSGEGSSAPSNTSGNVVASKNGTKYHYPWCAGAKQIAEKNKISFDSIEEARAAGYTPASNCKGLK